MEFAYTDLLICTAAEADRRKLVVISHCSGQILGALDEFVAFMTQR